MSDGLTDIRSQPDEMAEDWSENRDAAKRALKRLAPIIRAGLSSTRTAALRARMPPDPDEVIVEMQTGTCRPFDRNRRTLHYRGRIIATFHAAGDAGWTARDDVRMRRFIEDVEAP